MRMSGNHMQTSFQLSRTKKQKKPLEGKRNVYNAPEPGATSADGGSLCGAERGKTIKIKYFGWEEKRKEKECRPSHAIQQGRWLPSSGNACRA
jgi:hypothetical protein